MTYACDAACDVCMHKMHATYACVRCSMQCGRPAAGNHVIGFHDLLIPLGGGVAMRPLPDPVELAKAKEIAGNPTITVRRISIRHLCRPYVHPAIYTMG